MLHKSADLGVRSNTVVHISKNRLRQSIDLDTSAHNINGLRRLKELTRGIVECLHQLRPCFVEARLF